MRPACGCFTALTVVFQVRAGVVAERVAVEGVMLQYAVDCKLDELLSAAWLELTSEQAPRTGVTD